MCVLNFSKYHDSDNTCFQTRFDKAVVYRCTCLASAVAAIKRVTNCVFLNCFYTSLMLWTCTPFQITSDTYY